MHTNKETFLELSEATQLLGLSERTLRRRIETGACEARKVGRKWYVKVKGVVPQVPPIEASVASDAITEPQTATPDRSSPSKNSHPLSTLKNQSRPVHVPAADDICDQVFSVGRLAAWHKLRDLRSASTSAEDLESIQQVGALLLEGFLAYSQQKVDCYRACRSILCRLVIRLTAGPNDHHHLHLACEALSAVQALVVTVNRRQDPKSKAARDRGVA